jgi:replicative DNA helicase
MAPENRLPFSPEAERGVLGGVLLDPDIAVEVFGLLVDEDFHDPRNRAIFATLRLLYDRGDPVDLVTALAEHQRRTGSDDPADTDYITDLTNDVAYMANVLSYAGIVREKSQLRQLVRVSNETVRRVMSGDGTSSDLLDQAEQRIFGIAGNMTDQDFRRAGDIAPKALASLRQMSESKGGVTGLSTGLEPLDRLTTGFHQGELIILAARPGVGKTSLALNMARHIAEQGRGCVAFFSLEMSDEMLVRRLISMMSGIGTQPIIEGTLRPENWLELEQTARRLADLPIVINEKTELTSAELRAKVRRLHRREKVAAVFVDYLQLMKGADDLESHQLKVAMNSGALKALAKEIRVPVITLSQFSRNAAKREGTPRLSDLRDSGAIEQDADLVMFLHDEKADTGQAEMDGSTDRYRNIDLLVAKQRNGPRGKIRLVFTTATTRFDPAHQDEGYY